MFHETWRIQCDQCEKLGPEAGSPQQALDLAREDGWLTLGGRNDACTGCLKIPENTEPKF